MISRHKGILLLAMLIALGSCQLKTLFEETAAIPVDGWHQDSYISFSIPVEDTINQFEISLIIRNDARYEYSNLFLFINTTAPSGQGIGDTVEIRMADERGKWLGSGIGGKYTQEIPFKKQVKFPQIGSYTIELVQGMRDEELEFITDVGLRIMQMK